MVLKKHGLPDVSIKKMASGSVIGTLVSIPVSFLIAYLILQFADRVEAYAGLIFTLGAVLLALMTRNTLLSLIIILPFAMSIMGLRHVDCGLGIAPDARDTVVSFCVGVAVGPLAVPLSA